jgi:hypothetical protein
MSSRPHTQAPFIAAASYAIRIDKASDTITYVGYGARGAIDFNDVWMIMKLEKTGTVTAITYADGNIEFDNVWDNRASLVYL